MSLYLISIKPQPQLDVEILFFLRRPLTILSDEAETWLKQDETEFTTMHRTLKANEGSNID